MSTVNRLHPVLGDYLPQVKHLCQQYNISKLYAFGSITRPQYFNENSDLDFIAQFDEHDSPESIGEALFDLAEDFEMLFHRPVDLLRERSFRNPVFQRITDQTKVLIYDRRIA